MKVRYERAVRMLSWNLQRDVFRTPVEPVWQEDGTFWYRVRTPEGTRFRMADPEQGSVKPAFDHRLLAEAISGRTGRSVSENTLPFSGFQYRKDRSRITFLLNGYIWSCDITNYTCEEPVARLEPPADAVVSPDRRKAAFRRSHDLWVWVHEQDREIQLTRDGKKRYGYAVDSQGWSRSERPVLKWSPDSRRIATFRLDEREVAEMPLIRMRDGRPELETWPYALPGDTSLPMLERVIIDVKKQDLTRLELNASHMRSSNCCGLLRSGEWADVEWSPDGEVLAFVETSRDYTEVRLMLADPVTGSVREVIHETLEPFFESNLIARARPNWRVLHDSQEVIWFSPRDNWGHLYLYDLNSGTLKNRITEGDWNVMEVLHTDQENRSVLFTAVGREPGIDPYFPQLYRASLDGGEVLRVTPEDDHHQVSIDPDGRFAVVNRSRPDRPPVAEVYNMDGEHLLLLEEADLNTIEKTGFRFPVPFTVKARDQVTDLHGLLYKPSDFDPERRYPIINAIYPGPQTGSVGTRGFSTFRRGQAHALAELGFVVIQLDAFGTPFRSREFHTWWTGDLSDNGLQDQVTAMRQLADRHSWIDLNRSGIYGHSGGGYATVAAMLRYPDFFKAGVAGAGNLDNRGYTDYWGEKYQGQLIDEEDGTHSYRNQEIHRLADRLRGHLLITYGTADSNVHPNMTWQLIDSLIRHNRRFDLMVFPNRGHGYANEPYNLKLTWDYFVRHLLQVEPPFDISTPFY